MTRLRRALALALALAGKNARPLAAAASIVHAKGVGLGRSTFGNRNGWENAPGRPLALYPSDRLSFTMCKRGKLWKPDRRHNSRRIASRAF